MNRFRVNDDKELTIDMTKVDKVIIVKDDEEIEITEELIDLVKVAEPILISVIEYLSDTFKSLSELLVNILNQ